MPNSSEITWPPVRIAISSNMAFLRSPKPGAFTATVENVPLSLLTTRVAKASPSTSSAKIKKLLLSCKVFSRTGKNSWTLVIFLSVIII